MNPNYIDNKLYMKIEPVKVKKVGPDFKEEVELLRLVIDSGAKLKRLKNDKGEVTWIVSWGEISQ